MNLSALLPALQTQWRVILALILRETHTRFGQTRLGYFWALFESAMHVLVYIIIFGAIGRHTPLEGDLPFFFISGLVPFFLYQNIASRVMQAYTSNKALYSFPHVTPFDACISRYVLEIATTLIVLVLLIVGLMLIHSSVYLDNILSFMACLFCLSLLGLSIGIINANLLLFFSAYQNLYGTAQRFLYFTSGIFFVADMLPKDVIKYLWYNPLLHCVEWARSALYPNFNSEFVSYEYIFWWIGICLFFALGTQRLVMHKARAA